jgi:hypothetical protein
MSEPNQNSENVKKKKGKKTSVNNYFAEVEENAVREYLTATTFNEKNRIYNEFLKDPLDKMISSIIRRYKLYRKDMDFDELHIDTHSFLMTKIDKFKPSKEKKAYSYFGTICKNYLMGQIMKDQKDSNRRVSYEDISSDLENTPELVYYIENNELMAEEIVKTYLVKLKQYLVEKSIPEDELKLGYALVDLFENYQSLFSETTNNKLNRNIALFEIREITNLSTKDIRTSIKRYKTLYQQVVSEMLK